MTKKFVKVGFIILLVLAAISLLGVVIISNYTSYKILKAFHTMEVSFDKASEGVDGKNKKIVELIHQQAQNKSTRAKKTYLRAMEIQKLSNSFVGYIDSIKRILMNTSGDYKPDDLETQANFFFKNPDDRNARELTIRVNETRIKMLQYLNTDQELKLDSAEKLKIFINTNLKTDFDKKLYKSWASMYFEHSPLAGVITMLTKIQNDCRNTEADIIELLAKSL